ncbi:hydrolase 1, exosortase A system-associated [Erythrobacter sp. MTPC3]|uniref:hydrolase 1, exosortase A system-associated n=1 Tax=Erythrobacter sp. MTPC3 TaxID=3056564 RepID=UPI0036F3D270
MSRLHFQFGCGRLKLAGSLDTAPGTSGLLIVSGGNEIRSGAFSGQAKLAAAIAAKGFPVFRFDRRGVGDSEGENRGFTKSARDIEAALEAFRAMAPQMKRVLAFGNCDAASALMLSGGIGFDGLVLSNPWTMDDQPGKEAGDTSLPPPASIRARYAAKLKNPRELARLAKGEVNLGKLARGIARTFRKDTAPTKLADTMRSGLAQFEGSVRFLLAEADRTAQVFNANWDSTDPRIARCAGAGHAYAKPEERQWLEEQILAALRT